MLFHPQRGTVSLAGLFLLVAAGSYRCLLHGVSVTNFENRCRVCAQCHISFSLRVCLHVLLSSWVSTRCFQDEPGVLVPRENTDRKWWQSWLYAWHRDAVVFIIAIHCNGVRVPRGCMTPHQNLHHGNDVHELVRTELCSCFLPTKHFHYVSLYITAEKKSLVKSLSHLIQ